MKTIQYKDTYLTFSNYKEPLQKIKRKNGFGYYGVLLGTIDGKYVQCHICGKLFREVGCHARQAHKITIPAYKEKFKLAGRTALISEEERWARKNRTIAFLKAATEEEKAEWKRKANEAKIKRSHEKWTISLETKNKRGTCPDQLLAKITEIRKRFGRTPTLAEFNQETKGQRYKHLIFKTFGSWNNALKMLKLDNKEKKIGGFKKYSNEELLEYLIIFTQENQKIPTATDFNRGLLPSYETYTRRFGGIENARQEAGVYKLLD